VIPHPLKGQSPTLASLPAQLSWSIQIRPDPSPYTASPSWVSIAMPPNRPSWRQTTAASALPKPSSQTVPQRLLWSTSTRPQLGLSPLTMRMAATEGVVVAGVVEARGVVAGVVDVGNLDVVATMSAVDAALVVLADVVATRVERAVVVDEAERTVDVV